MKYPVAWIRSCRKCYGLIMTSGKSKKLRVVTTIFRSEIVANFWKANGRSRVPRTYSLYTRMAGDGGMNRSVKQHVTPTGPGQLRFIQLATSLSSGQMASLPHNRVLIYESLDNRTIVVIAHISNRRLSIKRLESDVNVALHG